MAHDVFISYSSRDKAAADAACAVLEQKEIRCWIAPRDIRPGDDWGETIIDAISAARVFLLIFSGNANQSQQVKREIERAVNRGLPVIPMRIEEVMPARALEYFLSTSHWLDAYTPPLAAHLDYLAGVIRQLLDGEAVRLAAPRPAAPASRRAVLGFGLAGVAAAGAALTYAFWPRDQVVSGDAPTTTAAAPQAPPRFEGKWVLESVEVSKGGWSALPVSNIAALNDPFVKASVEAKTLAVAFEISDLAQYTFDIEAVSEGVVRVLGAALEFTPDGGGKPFQSAFSIMTPDEAVSAVDSLGGKAGDSVLVFEGFPGFGPFSYSGTPYMAGPVDAAAGSWSTIFPPTPIGPATRFLDIKAGGRYRYTATARDRGVWQAADGKWSRQRQNGMEVKGVYRFEDASRFTMVSGLETMVFRRAG